MRKLAIPTLFIFVILLALSGYLAAKYLGFVSKTKPQSQSVSSSKSYEVKEVANGLYVPWSIAFTSETRFLVTERDGKSRRQELWLAVGVA
ncbi:MAG: Soluble aldose sugar dehydrogenase yliI [candidate division WWE3 bacterium GW2011_GWA1_46_21]|uniref:Soluble aldose sugar dehydrogenase yliI n=2 Tax=Katanobacteria TaxID=422282 RepID=A0A0G1PDS5_UNCKA|nr:MAG: Soluble aldose sugar dehydrogenase yliI [candidate division WWE3 bacterium GW2011_GWA1_46_21]KKU51071.1 MAG: Soluble aldose sugar dehydrogenase yliI [candidate division WWE3 bacterium GW2011_GWC1_47_10]